MPKTSLAICLSHVLVALYNLPVAGRLSASLSPNMTSKLEDEAVVEPGEYYENTACQEFRLDSPTGSGWLLADCIDVWKTWAPTLGGKTTSTKMDDRPPFLSTAKQLRDQGTPCYVNPPQTQDGAGSMSMRHIATKSYSADLGCDYLLPKGYQAGSAANGGLYCHAVQYKKQLSEINDEYFRCAAVDWIEYFSFSDQMAVFPNDGRDARIINARHPTSLQVAMDVFYKRGGFQHPPWVYWVLDPGNKAAGYFTLPSTWNAEKLENVRGLLKELRTKFWRRLRLSHPGGIDCSFSPSRINIAIHVRLGDRDQLGAGGSTSDLSLKHDKHYDMLEVFMHTVSEAILREGDAQPIFHIFSETSEPCPSTETGAFHEFLRWPVETTQVEECSAAVNSNECLGKAQGSATCNPTWPSVFRVQDKNLRLHVGPDVENAMSCMINADAVLMGCSTFGQVAGVFSEGLKFFSVSCEGWLTGPHYKMVPPMAIAEQGNMWVPVSGSWTDPAIQSEGIFHVAISQLLEKLRQTR